MHDYFIFIDVEEQKEITNSNFVENHMYMPEITRRFAYKGPGYLMNSGSFEWKVDYVVSYDHKYIEEAKDANGQVTYFYERPYESAKYEDDIRSYEFVYSEEGDYRSITYDGVFG